MKEDKILIETKDLCQYYPVADRKLFEKKRYVKAVEKLNIRIPKGCTYGLVGESGCGKSTTGEMLAGILPVTSGSILYDGKDLSTMDREEKKKTMQKIQMIFQDPYSSLNPRKKIGWILEEPLRYHMHLPKEECRKRVREVLKVVGLEESYLDRYPSELSGGQRQRISIAAALVLDPEFVIADEAVSALDVSVQAQILNLMKVLQKQRNLTYLFISHDLNVVRYMSDYIGVMYLGQLAECGPADEVYHNPVHPYTRALLSAVPDVRGSQKKRIVLHGEVPGASNIPDGCPFHTRCPMAKERCLTERPVLKEIAPGHFVSCHNRIEE